MQKLNELTAREAARRLAAREITAEQMARACLARIEERESTVGAWIHMDPDAVLAQARQLDAGPVRGPLHGLPIGVKDIMDTIDMPTCYGSAVYPGHRPAADAAAVALARAAGALILGKTVSTEFAWFHPGKTANPRDPRCTPGGSSSGSAAAVADAMVPLAFGTQTAGSIVRPASYCGVVGYKPTYATLPRSSGY
jgi:Asp-tRNA(Asn)/Glu-tRNA(Gln) amidotransferase A subunit family amidase